VRCFQRNRGEKQFHRRQIYWETEQWFGSRDSLPIFSFESVCLILGLSADGIRTALQDWVTRRADGRIPPFLELESSPHPPSSSRGPQRSERQSRHLILAARRVPKHVRGLLGAPHVAQRPSLLWRPAGARRDREKAPGMRLVEPQPDGKK